MFYLLRLIAVIVNNSESSKKKKVFVPYSLIGLIVFLFKKAK